MTTLEERVAQAIAFALAVNTDLPDWLQTPALGRDMLPLGELAAPAAIEAAVGAVLSDLRERLVKADETLVDLSADKATRWGSTHRDVIRLRSKAEGVRLALSSIDEAIKESQR